MSVNLSGLVSYLDDYLRVGEVADEPAALNGLQVENDGHVSRIAVAVDACQVTIDAAGASGADLLLVHHGLFWGGLTPLTGRHGRRVRTLIANGTALYSAHIPLDVHPEVGNNVTLARMLGVAGLGWFGDYRGQAIGVIGECAVPVAEVVQRLGNQLGVEPHVVAAGPDPVRRIAVITGGGGPMIEQARAAGADTYVTGEGSHHTFFDAEEWGLNLIYAGHYATETVGVKALAAQIEQKFGLPWHFIDHPTGL